MSFLDRVLECNNAASIDGVLPFLCEEIRVGWVEAKFAAALASFPEVFSFGPDGISIIEDLIGYNERTLAMDKVVRSLKSEGWFGDWRDERYPVGTSFYEKSFFEIERSAVPRFGIRAYGVHVNGFVRSVEGIHLWIGRRSADKANYPELLDNMVAGGQPVGISLIENVIKEASEEASIPRPIAEKAIPVGAISYFHQSADGIKPDIMFNFDMEVPKGFVPKPRDGEMSSFELIPVEMVMQICSETQEFKFNCALVNIDFFIRHGLLSPMHPDYLKLVRGMHS
ncbi:MAG: DUF4743 domain-containing protein [Rhodospirillaceae bacterium]|nr:DUF4743 domain-containing protein [Rhodospirillaceae bacterium]